jgi:ankyrin repeat protein
MKKYGGHNKKAEQLVDACKSGDLATVRKLLDEGVDVNWKDRWGYTGLNLASLQGLLETVELLLDRGTQIDNQNKDGWTSLMEASSFGRVDCVRLLLERGGRHVH